MLPLERPGKIVAVGLNYRGHADEQGAQVPERPLLFAKWQTALIGPGEPIVLPAISSSIDYEAELGVVLGERVKGIAAVDALAAVRGYATDSSSRGGPSKRTSKSTSQTSRRTNRQVATRVQS